MTRQKEVWRSVLTHLCNLSSLTKWSRCWDQNLFGSALCLTVWKDRLLSLSRCMDCDLPEMFSIYPHLEDIWFLIYICSKRINSVSYYDGRNKPMNGQPNSSTEPCSPPQRILSRTDSIISTNFLLCSKQFKMEHPDPAAKLFFDAEFSCNFNLS